MNLDKIKLAEVCHAVNRAYCAAIGDMSQVPWAELPGNIKASTIDGVEFHFQNPDAAPGDSHHNWLVFKKADGWVFGPEKDIENKTHPCMVPFDELPLEQQVKDHLFKAVVESLRGNTI